MKPIIALFLLIIHNCCPNRQERPARTAMARIGTRASESPIISPSIMQVLIEEEKWNMTKVNKIKSVSLCRACSRRCYYAFPDLGPSLQGDQWLTYETESQRDYRGTSSWRGNTCCVTGNKDIMIQNQRFKFKLSSDLVWFCERSSAEKAPIAVMRGSHTGSSLVSPSGALKEGSFVAWRAS